LIATDAYTILSRDLKMRRISARWIPHLLTKEQKHAWVRIFNQLWKQFPKYKNRSFANILTGDETWVRFYEPKRKKHNNIGATKESQRPCIAKRTKSVKKVMHIIFFTNQGPANL
jgi:histone-lysine N-methyltransferase SETMAR